MAEHTCPNCGSALEYVPDIHALKCAFCDSVQDVVDRDRTEVAEHIAEALQYRAGEGKIGVR